MHVGTRLNHQRAANLAVKRMFDDDVENLHAVIDQNLKLFFGSLGFVAACQNRLMGERGTFGEPIASRRSQYFLAAGSQNRHVLHDALPAHLKAPCQLTTAGRGSVSAHPLDDAAAAIIS